jgi:hypothetical protein
MYTFNLEEVISLHITDYLLILIKEIEEWGYPEDIYLEQMLKDKYSQLKSEILSDQLEDIEVD